MIKSTFDETNERMIRFRDFSQKEEKEKNDRRGGEEMLIEIRRRNIIDRSIRSTTSDADEDRESQEAKPFVFLFQMKYLLVFTFLVGYFRCKKFINHC